MKKLVVLLAGMLMLAAPALALIDNSAHDLPTTIGGNETDEICVFCHTPHGANAAFTGGPLWNRNAAAGGLVGVYSSGTLNASIDSDYTKIDAAACLTCHDGSQVMGGAALRNPPNTTVTGNYAVQVNGSKMLDNNMNNDHPVNFSYDASDAADAEINSIANVLAIAGQPIKFGTTSTLNNVVQCSSCHDVHNTVGTDLIVINNAGSNLCRACHIK
ncbi:MAG: hypothetical protein FDZ69_09025 [Deltaproteobacteria bacterium]|nr:MAG: hypothetical protein FDZ69_09025 [Deltaproteobacteria bacterium]